MSAEEVKAGAAAKVKEEPKGAPAPAAAKAVTPKVQAPAAANVTSTEAPAPAAAEVVATEAPAPAEAQPAASTSPISPLVAECLQEEPAAGAAEVTEAIDAAIAIDVDQLMASGTADATVVCKAVAASGSELDAVQCVSSLDQVPPVPVPAMLFSRGGGADSNATLAAALGGKALNLCTYRQCQEVKMSGGAKKFCFLHNRLHDNTRNDFKDQGQIKEFNSLNKKKDAQELWNAMDLKAEAKLLAHGETTLVDPSAPQRGKPTGRMDVVQFLASVSLTSGLDDVVQAPSPRQYGIEKLVDPIPDFSTF